VSTTCPINNSSPMVIMAAFSFCIEGKGKENWVFDCLLNISNQKQCVVFISCKGKDQETQLFGEIL
jgi:hypothetical protein